MRETLAARYPSIKKMAGLEKLSHHLEYKSFKIFMIEVLLPISPPNH